MPATWPELVRQRVLDQGDTIAFRFLRSGEEETDTLSYAGLDRRARAIAVSLLRQCSIGDRVLLIYPPGIDFITAFFGCLYAGVVAVPAYPPRMNESARRLTSILSDAKAKVALTTQAVLSASTLLTEQSIGETALPVLVTDRIADADAAGWECPPMDGSTLAFLQYTSGSTGQPKGVMLTHGNLLANELMIGRLSGLTKGEVLGMWLPLFHDMGLIGGMLHAVYAGATIVMMPPAAFLQKPLRWLQMMSRYRAAMTGAPDFAYNLCVKRTTVEERAGLDLSALRTAFNGSEPLRAETLEGFSAAFAPHGFRPEAFVPCYGMAETTLIVTGHARERAFIVESFDAEKLGEGRAVSSVDSAARRLVSSGRVARESTVHIVDPVTRLEQSDGALGEIWVRGPSVGLGYWNQPELSAATFGAHLAGNARWRYLRTGDLGFLCDGELFIAGRIKDLIIVRGRNVYPQDVELTAQAAHPALRPHGTAAFAIESAEGEAFVVVQEVERTALRTLDVSAVTAAIREAIVREHEVVPSAIVLVKPTSVPKTSSGKVQRSACRGQFLRNELENVGEWRAPAAALPPAISPVAAPIAPPSEGYGTTAALEAWLMSRVAAELRVAIAAVDPQAPLQSLGLDSMATVALAGDLEKHLGRTVEPTIVFDYPTIRQLARHFTTPGAIAGPARTASVAEAGTPDDRAVAIVGTGCRLPGGVNDLDAFWDLLRAGRDAVGDIPRERWNADAYFDANPDAPGKMYVRQGAFLRDVDQFDPEFFGLAPREAVAMDPQHRLLLELAWEALEQAAIPPASLAGTACGVFIGLSFDDYARLTSPAGTTEGINAYSALGGAKSLAAARLSYHLGLQGPALVVDTLCSSSLLAVHLAMQSLRTGECRVALAGGANLMLSPETTIASCKLRALAPDGRCKTFDARADGYGRGEGAGLVVLKRLKDALADGDPIVAVLRGSAVNHDGRSNGLTAPSAVAQEALLRRALADAGVAPQDVGFVETHGTGTVLGDPIEVQALARVYGENRPAASPLTLGAVKTNVGHLESAAGVAGLLKAALVLRQREIPANLHFQTPNPHIPWATLPLRVADRLTAWETPGRRFAGVSSFGLSGTNVHVVVEAAPEQVTTPAPATGPSTHVIALSARQPSAALALAQTWATRLEDLGDAALADACFTANTGRSPLGWRTARVGQSAADLARQLRALTPAEVRETTAPGAAIALLFTGQGSQYAGMAHELYQRHARFRATIDECAQAFSSHLPQPLVAILFGEHGALLEQTRCAQPALFSIEYALGKLWLEWGVRPAALFGHSLGEYAAACLAGVFSFADAVTLVAAKARLTHELPAGGKMISVAAAAEKLALVLARHPEVEVAAFNGASTTLAGPAFALERCETELRDQGMSARALPIPQAFHSRALDPLLPEFRGIAERITYHLPTLPLVTSRDGRVAGPEIATADYWVRQMREPVQFARAFATLAGERHCTTFLEIGPQPTLISLAREMVTRPKAASLQWLPSLRARRSDWQVLSQSAATLFESGVEIDWAAREKGQGRQRLAGLPTYPFQRRRCWIETPRLSVVRPITSEEKLTPTYVTHWQESLPPQAALLNQSWQVTSAGDVGADFATALQARGQTVVSPAHETTVSSNVLAVGLSLAEVAARARQCVESSSGRLWIVTRLALPTGKEDGRLNLDAAPLAGFARSFALEHAAHWGGLIDVEDFSATQVGHAVNELLGSSEDDVVAWRGPRRLVPRLAPHSVAATAKPAIDPHGTYFITGGHGAIGLALAEWLVAEGARHLVTFSRSESSSLARMRLDALQSSGAEVRWQPGDVTVRDDVVRALATIDATAFPLVGVFHAAGVSGFEPFTALTPPRFEAVLAPKVIGARWLDELTSERALRHFVLFSSISSVWGSSGQTHYAAANAALDALAHDRRARGLPVLAINWGPWDEAGMAVAARDQLRRIGIAPIPPQAGLALLGHLLGADAPQIVAADVEWPLLHSVLSLRRPCPLLSGLVAAAPTAPVAPALEAVRLRAADPSQRDLLLDDYLQRVIGRILGRETSERIDPRQGFFALGMDSLMAVELRVRLEADLGVKLATTVAFDRATLVALRDELKTQLFAVADNSPPQPASSKAPLAATEPIAIVGLGCRFPGGVKSPEDFWALLRDGREGITPVPRERWEADVHYHPEPAQPGKMYVREFGFIDGVDRFDHAFFGIFPREAAGMDPQQRLVLETAWEALESAGLANAQLRGSATGVFVGVSTNDYASLRLQTGDPARLDAYFGTGNALNAVAGRLAYVLGLNGPTLVTDTACSSSLVALHQACLSLRAGECQQALVAGVNLMLMPEPAIALCQARMLSRDGRCKTFSADANGYGRGEGVGVVVLKPLAAARAAGDPVLAVIRGSAVNQDGAGSGFTVPNGNAQQELIHRALTQAGRTPADLDYVEAHGTGTPLGDPIELNALAAIAGGARERPLFVGSVKTNLGHLEAAAGIAGVIKTVLALGHGAIPAHLHCANPTTHFPWGERSLRVPTQLTAWPGRAHASPRLAGVSAFGFTGTNAHVVLESAPAAANDASEEAPHLIPLSAKTPEALRELRAKVLAWLKEEPALQLADVARTFGTGRMHQEIREAYVTDSVAHFCTQLSSAGSSAGTRVAATPTPLTWVCREAEALAAGQRWVRAGLQPGLVLGEGRGLVAAGVLAGIFHADEADRLQTDAKAIEAVSPRSPRCGFGTAQGGRIDDAQAGSREWWRTALAEAASSPEKSNSVADGTLLLRPLSSRAWLEEAGRLYVAGHTLDWGAISPRDHARHLPQAPRYAFQRTRHWFDLAPAKPATRPPVASSNALLGVRLALPGSEEIRFATEYSASAPAVLDHHRLFGHVIAPGAQHVAALLAAARTALRWESGTLSGLRFPEALRLAEGESRGVQVVLSPTEQGFKGRVVGAPAASDQVWSAHAEARLVAGAESAFAAVTLPTTATETSGEEFHRVYAATGYTLGPSFRWVQSLRQQDDTAIGLLQAPAGALETASYDLHPGLLDSCFQLLGWCAGIQRLHEANGAALYIPAGIEAVRFFRRPSARRLVAEVRVTDFDRAKPQHVRGDIRLREEDGIVVLEVSGFEARRAPRELLLGRTRLAESARFYAVQWIDAPPAAGVAGALPQIWNLLGESATARALGERLVARGHRVDHLSVPAADATGVVLFCDEPAEADDPTAAQAARLLTLVQTLAALERQPRLWLVTRGAQLLSQGHGAVPVGAAAALGLLRIVAQEHPELRVVAIDLDPDLPSGESEALEQQLLAVDEENQVALRGPRRLVARLAAQETTPHASERAQRLTLQRYGELDSLALTSVTRRAPAAGEVEIEVRAAGMNFRDVLNALGVLEAHLEKLGVSSADRLPLGGECAGVVVAVGAGVKHLQVGHAVVAALATGCMGSHVTVDARFVAPKPAASTWTEAATLPVAYLTAWHGLHELASLRAGEKVLIHSAAGGVGLAAVHVARALGADVYATASPAKWPALRALGVTHLAHSRTTDYAREFPPVDAVLNSSPGEHIPRSLELLAPGGRFVEIGKAGIWSAEQVAVKRPDVAYHAFDLVEMARATPGVIQRVMTELARRWQTPELPALPWRAYPLTQAADAFRFMAQARQVGKIVLTTPPATMPRPRRDGVYVVTGGLGAIGFAVAGWLARSGAGTIVLVGRRAPSPEQQAIIAGWRAGGTPVVTSATDLAAAGAVTRLIADVATEFGPVRGVFHAAGVLDDGLIRDQTPARLATVYGPKAGAAWQLHQATLTQPLDYFVLFSSLAALHGRPGQATYAAANAALDALAWQRQRLGLPALSINWGPWAGGGMAGRLDSRQRAQLDATGLTPFTTEEGLTALVDLLETTDVQVTAARFDLAALIAGLRGRRPALLEQLLSGIAPTPPAATELRATLQALAAAERHERVARELSLRFAELLGLASNEQLPRDRPLDALGFDSLMLVELKSWLAGSLEIEIPLQEMARGTVDGLVQRIVAALGGESALPGASRTALEAQLRHDAQLPADVRLDGPAAAVAAHRDVLLTGATGFLGAFLLRELLTTTAATIHCLVRAETVADGLQRVLANLQTYGLPIDSVASRLVIHLGDLAEPRLGLGESGFAALAKTVDTIYHNGAWLNFFYAYETLKPANVLGTLEVLRLATQGTPKPVHYVSTSGVFYSQRYRGQILPESDAADHCEAQIIGYSQSKWVAERLVAAAGACGLPVTIHRAPFITGHAQTGAWNSDDFICRLVRGVIALGAMPELSATMDIVPVDYVARSIVSLAQRADSSGQRFHLCASTEVAWTVLARWLEENGYPVVRESYAAWLTRLPALRNTSHPLAPFVTLFLEKPAADLPTVPEFFLQAAHSRLDGTHTAQRLAREGVLAPVIDGALWKNYLQALAEDGLLPAPSASR